MRAVSVLKTFYYEKYSQAVLMSLDGELIESCDTLHPITAKFLFIEVPFLESIKHVLQKLTLDEEISFPCIDGESFGHSGYFDFIFKKVLSEDRESILWIIMDFTEHYENVIVSQQQRNDSDIRSEYLELEQENTKLEKELLEYKNLELQRMQELKTAFFSKISHEIRNPINGIVGLVNLISESRNAHKTSDYINSLKLVTRHLGAIVNDVLDLSKLESGKIEFESVDFVLREVVQSAISAFAFTCKEKGVTLSFKIGDKLSSRIKGDSVKLSQVMYNLIGNAVKFTDHGSISLSVQLVEQVGDNYIIQFTVSDTGIGIPMDRMSTVFDAYVQAESSTNRLYGGTGLGLPIVKQFVELQGGQIHIKSEVNKGTDFIVELPFGVAETDAGLPQSIDYTDKKSLRILVAEDDPVNREILLACFEKWGYDPYGVENGQEALVELSLNTYDLLILDHNMPIKNGFETLKEARTRGIDIPVYVFSGEITKEFTSRFSVLEVAGFLQKPLDPEDLKILLSQFVSKRSGVKATKKEAIVNLSALHDLLDGDPKRIQEILDLFAQEMPKNIRRMKMLYEENNWQELKVLVHKAKSSFTYIGIPELTESLHKLEDNLITETKLETYGPILDKVDRTVNAAVEYLKNSKIE